MLHPSRRSFDLPQLAEERDEIVARVEALAGLGVEERLELAQRRADAAEIRDAELLDEHRACELERELAGIVAHELQRGDESLANLLACIVVEHVLEHSDHALLALQRGHRAIALTQRLVARLGLVQSDHPRGILEGARLRAQAPCHIRWLARHLLVKLFVLHACLLATAVLASAPTTASAASKSNIVPLSQLTDAPVVHGGEYWISLADVGRLAQCQLSATDEVAYEAWPCKDGGLLEVDTAGLDGYGGPDSVPRRKGSVSPGDTKGFNPQPDPPKTFTIGDTVISKRVLTGSDGGWMPLVDLAKAMGGKVRSRGGKTFIALRRATKGKVPLHVSITDGTSKS